VQRPTLRSLAGPLLWGTALAVALAIYAGLNGPVRAAASALQPIGFALAMVLAFLGLGGPVVRRAWPGLESADSRLLAVALGGGITALFVFLPGLAGHVDSTAYAVLILAGLGLAVVEIVRQPPRLDLSSLGGVDVTALVLLVVFLAAMVPMLAAPPTTTDALEFHLLVPKTYLADGAIHVLPGLVESNYPSLAEYLFMVALPLAGPVACKGLHFWFGVLLLVALARLAARIAPDGSRLLGPALYQTMPVAALILAWAWNDTIFVFFLILALTALVDYHAAPEGQRKLQDAVRAGLMLGLAGWTKYTIVLVGLALVPVVLLGLWRWRWRLAHVLAAAVTAAGVSLTWIVKNWAFTGNPVFPFLNGIFHSPLWSSDCHRYFVGTLTRYEIPHWSWMTYLTFPFRLSLTPRVMDTHIGVLPLLLAPLLFLRSRSRAETPLKLFAASSVLAWLAIQTETRSLLTLFAVVACLGAVALDRAARSRPGLQTPLAVLLGFVGAANLTVASVIALGTFAPIPHFLGMESSADYLRREARSQRSYEWLNTSQGVETVLLVGLHGPFYLERPALFSSCCDTPIAQTISAGARAPEEIWRRLRALHVSHVVVNEPEWEREHREGLYSWGVQDRRRFEEFLSRHCRPVARFGGDTIYVVSGNPSPSPSLLPRPPDPLTPTPVAAGGKEGNVEP